MELVKDVPSYILKMYEGNYFMNNFGINIEEIHCGSAVVSLDIVKENILIIAAFATEVFLLLWLMLFLESLAQA